MPGTTKILRYSSVGDYLSKNAEYLHSTSSTHYVRPDSYESKWAGGYGTEDACALAKAGLPSLTERFKTDTAKFNLQVSPAMKPTWVNDYAGAYVSVPRYVGGNPACMRRKAPREGAVRSVSVYVSLTSSAHMSADDLIRRGCAILSLLETLQSNRVAVDLHLVTELEGRLQDTDNHYQVIRVENSPLDLSSSGFAIAHPTFARAVTYCTAGRDGFTGGFSRNYNELNGNNRGDRGAHKTATKAYLEETRKVLDMGPDDIFIPIVGYGDPLITNPEQWLKDSLDKVLKGGV